MYSLEQDDQVRGELSYINCLDMMNGCLPSSSQSFPWPSWWIPKLCSNTTNMADCDLFITHKKCFACNESIHVLADMVEAFSSRGCKKLIPLNKKLANLSRIQHWWLISVLLRNCYQCQKQQLCLTPVIHASYNFIFKFKFKKSHFIDFFWWMTFITSCWYKAVKCTTFLPKYTMKINT